MLPSDLAMMIDHTALSPETSHARIAELCKEAQEYTFGAVCIAPVWISSVKEFLSATDTKIVTVIGFPLGNTFPEVKAYEALLAVEAGAHELDMVMNIDALKSGNQETVLLDIQAVTDSAKKRPGTLVKVILETALLTDEEKVLGCQLAITAGADFVKTSTGFTKGGATAEDVALIRKTVGDRMKVKAAGGIRTLSDALAMIKAGADRLGCSSSVAIMKEALNRKELTV
jgi:deoxyribose-phosphate aldolase